MKKTLLTLTLLLSFCLAYSQTRQPRPFSIEVSFGIPPISALMADPSNHNNPPAYDYDSHGIVADNIHKQHFNTAFGWNCSKRWDCAVMLGATFMEYQQNQYREWVTRISENGQSYGVWVGGPDKIGKKLEVPTVCLSAIARVKYAYMGGAHLYSAFGLGADSGISSDYLPFVIAPYLSPIGISIGDNSRLIVFAELTLGTGGTFAIGGLGFRL